nr:MAG TPA: transmembrane protein [Caudoviricetes sp.]
MHEDNNQRGIKVLDLLTILFIGLKLTGNISWSWVWVLSPEWISLAIYLLLTLSIKWISKR